MAINRNTTFNPNDMNFMDRDFGDSDMDNQGKGRVRKAIKLIFFSGFFDIPGSLRPWSATASCSCPQPCQNLKGARYF